MKAYEYFHKILDAEEWEKLHDAKNRIASQMPLKEKCQKSNHIIDNSKDLCYTISQINELLNKINNKLGGF